jgi:hypothetical protein
MARIPISTIRRSENPVVAGKKRGLALKPRRTAKILRVYAAANIRLQRHAYYA